MDGPPGACAPAPGPVSFLPFHSSIGLKAQLPSAEVPPCVRPCSEVFFCVDPFSPPDAPVRVTVAQFLRIPSLDVRSHLCHLLAVQPWRLLYPLSALSLLVCEMGVITAPVVWGL